jgi:hypothetical protein
MSIVSADVTRPLFRAVCMSWVNVNAASVVELPLRAPNWENGVSVCLLRKYVSVCHDLF